jgi:DNA helicase HerA-like ATPase
MNNGQREIHLIFGRTGEGKSTLAQKILAQYKRKIIIDPLHEYDGTLIFDFESFKDFSIRHRNDSSYRIVLRFHEDSDIEDAFKIIKASYLNVCLLVEEVELYVNPYTKFSTFNWFVRYGRHKNISLIGIARRPTELSKDFRAQAAHIYSFAQTDISDIQYFGELGLNVENLPKHKFVEKIL